jgi:hypothetical protein
MFNLTQETYWLALLTAFYFVLMTQSLKFILNLVLDKILVLLYGTTSKEDQSPSSSICWLTFLAFASTFFPNIYGWWMWFNYINDEFVTFVATQVRPDQLPYNFILVPLTYPSNCHAAIFLSDRVIQYLHLVFIFG